MTRISRHLLLAPMALFAFSCVFSPPSLAQGAPKKNSILGISIGDTPQAVERRLGELYPGCDVQTLTYIKHEPHGTPPGVSKVGDIISSDDDDCTKSQKQSGKVDHVEVTYLHASRDPQSPVYEIQLSRVYDEIDRFATGAVMLDELIDTFTAEYGRPLSSSRKIDSSAVQIRKILRSKSNTTPYVTELKWASSLPKKYGICLSGECGPLTLDATIESEGTAGNNPKQLRVKRVRLTMTDHVLYDKHLDWKLEFDELKKKNLKSF